MEAKTTVAYRTTFQIISNEIERQGWVLHVQRFQSDFEVATIHAMQAEFPNVHLSACWFHLCQLIVKRVKAVGCWQAYSSNINGAARVVQKVAALAHLPPDEIPFYFDLILTTGPQNIMSFMQWFKACYIGTLNIPPRFPPSLWSIGDQFLEGMPRTQNWAEQYHRKLNQVLEKNPPLYKLLGELKDRMDVMKTVCIQSDMGQPQSIRREVSRASFIGT